MYVEERGGGGEASDHADTICPMFADLLPS